jgi:transcriptional regulator with XRE-family HTH domain
MTSPTTRTRELGALLRARRDGLRPVDVGLPDGARRRTPGLRREEVAGLAAISTTYYTYLEQGRPMRPSREVLDALAEVLQLSPAERAHAHALAYGSTVGAPSPQAEKVAPGVRDLVARLDPHPTYVTGRYWDVLAANPSARALWTDWPSLPDEHRNMLWWTFLDPHARQVLVDWELEARALLARYRSAAHRSSDDPRFTQRIEAVLAGSADARRWWPDQSVGMVGAGVKRLHHPALGRFELRHVVLQVADEPDQKVVTFSGEPALVARIGELAAELAGELPDVNVW